MSTLNSALFPAPTEITYYHAPWLEAAEAGRLRYDTTAYPIHGLVNNAVWCIWHGLLEDAPDGPVLTDLGARLLAEWRRARTGPSDDEKPPQPRREQPAAPVPPVLTMVGGWEQPALPI